MLRLVDQTYVLEQIQQWVFFFSRSSALGPICWPLPSSSQPLCPIKFLGAIFDFLPVCVIKCSCATSFKHSSSSPSYLFTNIIENKGLSCRLIKSCKKFEKFLRTILIISKFSQGTVVLWKVKLDF